MYWYSLHQHIVQALQVLKVHCIVLYPTLLGKTRSIVFIDKSAASTALAGIIKLLRDKNAELALEKASTTDQLYSGYMQPKSWYWKHK